MTIKKWEGEDIRGLEDVILALKALAIKEGDNNPALLLKIVIKFDSGNEDNGLGSG